MHRTALDPQLNHLGISPATAALQRPANYKPYVWTAPEETSTEHEGSGVANMVIIGLVFWVLVGLGLLAIATGVGGFLTEGWSP